jgi:hypothetical protein
LVGHDFKGFALRINVLGKFGVHPARSSRLTFGPVAICTVTSIGLWPRGSSIALVSRVSRFGVPAFGLPSFRPSAMYLSFLL